MVAEFEMYTLPFFAEKFSLFALRSQGLRVLQTSKLLHGDIYG